MRVTPLIFALLAGLSLFEISILLGVVLFSVALYDAKESIFN